jgi:uncharacterized protein YjiS (DUF1127 family)
MQDLVGAGAAVRWQALSRWLADQHALLASWRERRRARQMLLALDERMLADIGLSRADVEAECGKPFWLP